MEGCASEVAAEGDLGLSVFYMTWGGILQITETKGHTPDFTRSHVPELKAEDDVAHAVSKGTNLCLCLIQGFA